MVKGELDDGQHSGGILVRGADTRGRDEPLKHTAR